MDYIELALYFIAGFCVGGFVLVAIFIFFLEDGEYEWDTWDIDEER